MEGVHVQPYYRAAGMRGVRAFTSAPGTSLRLPHPGIPSSTDGTDSQGRSLVFLETPGHSLFHRKLINVCANYLKRPFEPPQRGREMTCGVGLPGRGSGSGSAGASPAGPPMMPAKHFHPKGGGSIEQWAPTYYLSLAYND